MGQQRTLIFRIAAGEAGSPTFVDNFRQPALGDDLILDLDADPGAAVWPRFHASDADPEAGYRSCRRSIDFTLPESGDHAAHELEIEYQVLSARVPWLELFVNGRPGAVHLAPKAADGAPDEIHASLHTSIHAGGTALVRLPPGTLRAGRNRISFECRGPLPDEMAPGGGRTTNREEIARLDRMANSAGILYRSLRLDRVSAEVAALPNAPAAGEGAAAGGVRSGFRAEIVATAIRRGDRAQCTLVMHWLDPHDGMAVSLQSGNGGFELLSVEAGAVDFGDTWYGFGIPVDPVPEAGIDLRLQVGASLAEISTKLPTPPNVYLFLHCHTDVGYTHRQWEIAERQSRNIDAALALCRSGDAHYHIDAGWVVERYLEARSDLQSRRLFAAMREGKISVSAGYLDLLTQFASLEDLIRNVEMTLRTLEPGDATTRLASVVDVPSLSGSLPGILEGCGVEYLLHAANQDRGPFRLKSNLHRNGVMRWRGTNGGSVRYWIAKMYCELRKVCGSPPDRCSAASGLDLWLQEWDGGTPGAVVLFGQEADNTDLDPGPMEFVRRWNDEIYSPRLTCADPTLFFEDAEREIRKSSAALPEVLGDSGAYWEDGVLSSLRETVLVRASQAKLPAAELLESLSVASDRTRGYPHDRFRAAWREELLYVEHTWGAFLSASAPGSALQHDSWTEKASNAVEAHRAADALFRDGLTRHILSWNADTREIVVYNPSSWSRSGPADVEISTGEEPDPSAGIVWRTKSSSGDQRIIELWIDEIPGNTLRRIPLVPAAIAPSAALRRDGSLREGAAQPRPGGTVIAENERFRVEIARGSGAITSIIDKQSPAGSAGRSPREIVRRPRRTALGKRASAPGQFGEPVYVSGGSDSGIISNAFAGSDPALEVRAGFRGSDDAVPRQTEGTAAGASNRNPNITPNLNLDVTSAHAPARTPARAEVSVEEDAVATRVTIEGSSAGGRAVCVLTVPRRGDFIELAYTLEKPARDSLEALYIAFPFAVDSARLRSDSQIGWVDWQKDALPGCCHDWYPLQTSILLEEPSGYAIQLTSPDVPLFCSGDIVRGRWSDRAAPVDGRIYSYLMNNYWRTNYLARQGGSVTVRYRIRTHLPVSVASAFRAGWGDRLALQTFRSSYQAFRPPADADTHSETVSDPGARRLRQRQLVRLDNANVVLVAVTILEPRIREAPDGRGRIVQPRTRMLLRFAEIGGNVETARVELRGVTPLSVSPCDHTGRRPVASNTTSPEAGAPVAKIERNGSIFVRLRAFEVLTIQLECRD